MCVELQSLMKIKLTDDPFSLKSTLVAFSEYNKGNMIK